MASSEDLHKVISLLCSLLSDLHYESRDQADYLKRHGYCSECYSQLQACTCIEEEDSEEVSKEDEVSKDEVSEEVSEEVGKEDSEEASKEEKDKEVD